MKPQTIALIVVFCLLLALIILCYVFSRHRKKGRNRKYNYSKTNFANVASLKEKTPKKATEVYEKFSKKE